MKQVAVLLPRVFPDFFWVWAARRSTTVILHDTLYYDRKAHVNRGRIQTPDGAQFVYIPMEPVPPQTPLYAARVETPEKWIRTLHKTLVMNYRNAVYFDFYEPEVMADFEQAASLEGFAAFATYLTGRWLRYLDVPVQWTMASSLPGAPARTGDIRTLCGAERVLLDPSARQYQPQCSERADVSGFVHPEYRHHFGFEPGCTILDLLFSCGPESWKVLDRASLAGG